MFRSMIYGFIYLWLRYQAISNKVHSAYKYLQSEDTNPFYPYIRYPFVYRQPISEHESYFEIPSSSFRVLTEHSNQRKVESLDRLLNNIDGMPPTVEAYPNGMFKARNKLVTRTQDSYYWN